MDEAMHLARLAMLEGALAALLREPMFWDPAQSCDGINVRASLDGSQSVIEVEYTRGGLPVAAESL